MCDFSRNVEGRWMDNRKKTKSSCIANSTSILVSRPHNCWHDETARLVASPRHRPRVHCGDVSLRIIFVGMMIELETTGKPHKNDDLSILQTQEVF